VTYESIPMILTAEAAAAIPEWSPPEGYTLREYKPSDNAGCVKCLMSCSPAFGAVVPAVSQKVAQGLGRGGAGCVSRIIVDDEEQPVATAHGWQTDTDPTWAHMSAIAVRPDHRRRGFGFGVCAAVIAVLVGRGVTRIKLGTGSNDFYQAARNLYEKLGFKYNN